MNMRASGLSERLIARPASAADQVYDMMLHAIVTGGLVSGQELRDRDWSEAAGVSRTPVREAIQRLDGLGLVDIAAARYTRVRSFTRASALQEAHGWASLHLALLGTVLGTRTDEALLVRLQRAHSAHHRTTGDKRLAAGFAFFAALRQASPHFGLRLGGAASAYRLRLASAELPSTHRAEAGLHADLIAAVTAGDTRLGSDAFRRWARAHARETAAA
jgi:DNA-binding GntR family transcriptional regulator